MKRITFRPRRKFLSLQTKYMLIVLTALFLINILIIATSLVIYSREYPTLQTETIEKNWHQDAAQIGEADGDTLSRLFDRWKTEYPEAAMFWVDETGRLALARDVTEPLPEEWTAAFTARFIKDRYDNDPFTVIAFIQGDYRRGFIVFEMARKHLGPTHVTVNSNTLAYVVPTGIILFTFISYLFFRNIRKRLLSLQEAMGIRDQDGLPVSIDVAREDEIGQLEAAFNRMVEELKQSRDRERQEEQLRRELVANLSHDLRTPLTKIRAHTYTLGKESLSETGQHSIRVMEDSVRQMDSLISNLMTYTLLSARKFAANPVQTDPVRLLRKLIASWYPLFEKEGFQIDVRLEPFDDPHWTVDPLWLERIFDNLLQNVLRHARDGRYIGLWTESTDESDALVIADRGPGMEKASPARGAGIGLTIVSLMVSQMGLDWKIDSSEQGTTVSIMRRRSPRPQPEI